MLIDHSNDDDDFDVRSTGKSAAYSKAGSMKSRSARSVLGYRPIPLSI